MNEEKAKKSLSGSFLRMTLIPLIVMILVVVVAAGNLFTIALQREVRKELYNAASQIKVTYDTVYPGSYQMVENPNVTTSTGENLLIFAKGNQILSEHYDLIDGFHRETGLEASFFAKVNETECYRVLTTIADIKGNRIVGTGAHPKIVSDVVINAHEAFYTNATINGISYFAYYMPIEAEDGTIFGIIGIARQASDVKATVYAILIPGLIICLLGLLVASFVSLRYSGSILKTLKKMEQFLQQVSKGNLNANLDSAVSGRRDEIGTMARAAITMESSLRDLVEKDALTNLYNRRYGNQKITKVWAEANRTGVPFAVAIGDVDFFKKVNDTYGHECGDEVLKMVARILEENMPRGGTVMRWGGEEFLMIFEGFTKETAARQLEEIIRIIGNNEVIYERKVVRVTMTVGVTDGDASSNADEVISVADNALYEGKQSGRNRVVVS